MILMAQFGVRDFAAWKAAFDEYEGMRAEYGGLGHSIYRGVDDPNEVTILFHYASRERAEEDLRVAAQIGAAANAGIIGTPRATWLTEADVATYAGSQAA